MAWNMDRTYIALGAFVTIMVACLCASVPADPIDTRPIVVLREDDCSRQWTIPYVGLDGHSGLQYGKSKRIPITWGIISNWATTGQSLTWSELRDYLDTAGGEAASHSVTHTPQTSAAAYVAEITASKAEIEANLPGYACTTFYQPGVWGAVPDSADALHAYMDEFSELNNPIGQAIRATYVQSMAYLAAGWQVGPQYYKYGISNNYSVDAIYEPSIPGLEARLDTVAATPGAICVISCHGVTEQGVPHSGYAVPADILKALMDKLALLRDQGKIRLMGLHDALHTSLPGDLNLIPDSGFEVVTLDTMVPHGAWRLLGSASLAPDGGVGNSRCARVTAGYSTYIESTTLVLGPGRYRLSWQQRRDQGEPQSRSTSVCVINTKGVSTRAVNYPRFTNQSATEWEGKNVLLSIKPDVPMARVLFSADGGFRIDEVRLVSEPVDPLVSPSDVAITPSVGQCCLAWTTPDDPSVVQIAVRYGAQTHPRTTSEGTELGTTTAVPGARQQLFGAVDWSRFTHFYCSVFAVRANGTCSEPEIAMLTVQQNVPPPKVDALLGPTGTTIEASWIGGSPPGISYQFQYGLGSSPNLTDVVPWTSTQETHAIVQLPPTAPDTIYLLVKEQNVYGYWSPATAQSMTVPRSIPSLLGRPDGIDVSVTGAISAVFADRFYVQQANYARGLMIWGPAPAPEGTVVTVTGQLVTTNGERAVHPSGD